jgi:hypothetical protein
MGYNRSGTERTARLRRRKRLENRLAAKMAASAAPVPQEGLGQKVKHLAHEAVEKVGEVLHAAAEKVKSVVK